MRMPGLAEKLIDHDALKRRQKSPAQSPQNFGSSRRKQKKKPGRSGKLFHQPRFRRGRERGCKKTVETEARENGAGKTDKKEKLDRRAKTLKPGCFDD